MGLRWGCQERRWDLVGWRAGGEELEGGREKTQRLLP